MKCIRILSVMVTVLTAVTLLPLEASAEPTSSCAQSATGDLLAFYDGTSANCVSDSSASSFSVDATAYSAGPNGIGYCGTTGVGAACSSASVTFNEVRETDVFVGSVTVGGSFNGNDSATASGYAQGGSAYSRVAVSLYAYAYSCDWNWYNGWRCYNGPAKSVYAYVACSSGTCTSTSDLSVTVDVPYCNGYYCNTEWSMDSPYARVVVRYTITATANSTGYGSADAHADGVVTLT